MRRLVFSAIVIVTMWPSYVFAQATGHVVSQDLGRLVNNVACTASLSARTITFKQGETAGFEILSFMISETWNAASAVSMFCETSQDNQTTWGTLQACEKSGSVFSCTDAILSHPLTASDTWILRFDTVGSPNVRCIWSCTGGTGSDLVTIYGRMAAP